MDRTRCRDPLRPADRLVRGRWRVALIVATVLVLLGGCQVPEARPVPSAGTPDGSAAPSAGTGAPSASLSPSVSASASTPSSPSSARVVARRRIGGREEDLTLDSPAVGQRVHVRLLLPPHYRTNASARWPVLYLLHGCCDSYCSWTRSTDIERLTRSLDVLVVMPDGGPVGFYSNWRHGPQWETFHTQELPRLLSTRYRSSSRAAIAGVSMGGLGALDYAARHPTMFAAAASFSGIVHTRLSGDESQAYSGLVSSQGENPDNLWGDPEIDARLWAAHNPYDLAPRLRGVRLFVSAGNGRPGPLDPDGAVADSTESAIGTENRAFVQRLHSLGVPARVDLYGPGTHNWVYWQRELHRAWPLLTAELGLG